jgi:hypothetical protein
MASKFVMVTGDDGATDRESAAANRISTQPASQQRRRLWTMMRPPG